MPGLCVDGIGRVDIVSEDWCRRVVEALEASRLVKLSQVKRTRRLKRLRRKVFRGAPDVGRGFVTVIEYALGGEINAIVTNDLYLLNLIVSGRGEEATAWSEGEPLFLDESAEKRQRFVLIGVYIPSGKRLAMTPLRCPMGPNNNVDKPTKEKYLGDVAGATLALVDAVGANARAVVSCPSVHLFKARGALRERGLAVRLERVGQPLQGFLHRQQARETYWLNLLDEVDRRGGRPILLFEEIQDGPPRNSTMPPGRLVWVGGDGE